ncbi:MULTISPECIES: cysteine synthase family protein [Brevibacillus]|jgi:cysteine synthase A|uniref:Pyridoxal-phosphate dependent protein n=1 Tax=Brevibacillus borstelensis AK1 TaxID=1300222 RepID=M8D683_9BACL|nr:cysteine synthase family protein [Brevibacillus borstelensis]EMT51779.1 pyridoxal-phosphate dependent protein [Brevibacillus borstelensis AK1]KKX56138.1 pyridoxal-5'-phosphate-dependent protein [Brevibacillus borstelensis cifa_chp40]MBE5394373.1 cysteine synthase family protein [Brevibacillus borstelensis]MCC0564048.1 cysteine synthase family protein [Brevibacillus borstelensis]MCM3470220.1 cysteine synthase family protein [Brevibacillus borstelensis]
MDKSLIELIGTTPLIRLRLDENSKAPVYAKLELLNPYGMKDRVAKEMIMDAKRTGQLQENAPIVESSSGTLALGITMIGTYLGHEVHIVTDPRIDELTLAKLRALGAQVHIVEKMEQDGGWQKARLNYLQGLLDKYPNAYWPKQYENPQNPLAYQQLADDLVKELGRVDYLVGSVGSGGSLCGTAKALRERNPDLTVIAVDAVGSVIFYQTDNPKRLQSGLGNSLRSPNVDFSVIDEVHWLNDEEAFTWTRELAKQEKIFAGNSSGSVYAVSRWLSSQVSEHSVIACIFPDRGDRYIHSIYNDDFFNVHHLNKDNLRLSPNRMEELKDVSDWTYFHFNKGKFRHEEKTAVY